MDWHVEARVSKVTPFSGKATVHVDLGEIGGITIINIDVWERDGKITVKLPPRRANGNNRPDITMQGQLKQSVLDTIKKQFQETIFAPSHL